MVLRLRHFWTNRPGEVADVTVETRPRRYCERSLRVKVPIEARCTEGEFEIESVKLGPRFETEGCNDSYYPMATQFRTLVMADYSTLVMCVVNDRCVALVIVEE